MPFFLWYFCQLFNCKPLIWCVVPFCNHSSKVKSWSLFRQTGMRRGEGVWHHPLLSMGGPDFFLLFSKNGSRAFEMMSPTKMSRHSKALCAKPPWIVWWNVSYAFRQIYWQIKKMSTVENKTFICRWLFLFIRIVNRKKICFDLSKYHYFSKLNVQHQKYFMILYL